jgi:uncharacterized protein
MSLTDRIQKDLVEAMKAKEEARLGTLRMVKTAFTKWKADNMKEPDEATEQQILKSLVKQRMDSVEMYRNAGRTEQAAKEEAEIVLIESYMPQPARAEELEAAVAAAIAETPGASVKTMGLVMKTAQAKLSGKRIDGKALSELVKAKLS